MTRRTALLGAAAITAFVLALLAGLLGRVSQPAVAADAGPRPTVAVAEATPPPPDPVWQEREAAYRRLLAEANLQLQRAAQEQASLRQALEQLRQVADPQGAERQTALQASPGGEPPQAAPPAPEPTPGGRNDRERAIQLARAYAGEERVRGVELKREREATVYEVELGSGSKVYVDPARDQVVYARLKVGQADARERGERERDDDGD